MKIARLTMSAASMALLVVQLLLVSAVAAEYLYQRWRCPRVWTRATEVDPEGRMRGRYLEAQLIVDGCRSTLPSAKAAQFPRDVNGAALAGPYGIGSLGLVKFNGELRVENNELVTVKIEDPRKTEIGQQVNAGPGTRCSEMQLERPVAFYIAKGAQARLPLRSGQELWAEVTVPPKGPPRPLRLAVKDNGVWSPLE